MCFRPATMQQDIRCPKCAQSNPIGAKQCSACGADLPQDVENANGAPMPGAFGASGQGGGGFAPRQPGAPQSPQAPGAPKA
jgi:hypothetical protein